MRRLNWKIDRAEQPMRPSDVAEDFLRSENLIGANGPSGDGSGGTLNVGGKDFTEQDLLGELIARLVEYHHDLRVRRRLHLGGTMVCFNALRAGELDLYVEYTGTGWVSILGREAVPDRDAVYEAVSEEFALQWDLTWMEPLGFDNTYTLVMRRRHADELGIRTISDLAERLQQSTSAD